MSDFTKYFEMEAPPKVSDHNIWVERYRPTQFSDFIGSSTIKDTMRIWVERKSIPHLLFSGPPGTGKTSMAKMLIDHIPCDSLVINASDENGVDDIRNKVQDFCMTMGIHDLKILFLDECLDENTRVWIMRDGREQNVPIRELDQSNDLVKSFNIEKSRIEWRPFYLISKGIQDTYEIEFENGEVVVCTDTHKWHVKDSNGNIIRVKTSEFISGKYDYILTTEENQLNTESQ